MPSCPHYLSCLYVVPPCREHASRSTKGMQLLVLPLYGGLPFQEQVWANVVLGIALKIAVLDLCVCVCLVCLSVCLLSAVCGCHTKVLCNMLFNASRTACTLYTSVISLPGYMLLCLLHHSTHLPIYFICCYMQLC